jgi:uncharacterized membrane protein
MVGLGTLLVVVFGFWLVDLTAYGFDGWLLSSLCLVFAIGAGAVGGQAPKRARRLADALAGDGDRPSGELHALLHSRRAEALNLAAAGAVVAILVLMVWKPGA